MNIKNIFAFIILFCLPAWAPAQSVRLVNSTQQDWAGGIAGRTGSYLHFVIEFQDADKELLPDTIWIEHRPVPIVISDSNATQSANTKRTRTRTGIRFDISTGTAHDEYAERYNNVAPPNGGAKQPDIPKPPIPYKGIALISYQYKGSQHFFEVTRIMQQLPQIDYP